MHQSIHQKFPKILVLFVSNNKSSRYYFSEFVSYFILQNMWKNVKYISWKSSNTLFNKRGDFHRRRNRKIFSIKMSSLSKISDKL